MEYKSLKTTTIKQFREQFFTATAPPELVAEFDKFTNQRNFWSLYVEYVNTYARFLSQKIYDETKIGTKIGNLTLLKARFMQAQKNLNVFLSDQKKQKHEPFTEEGLVEWIAAVSKYYGYEIGEDKSVFDFLVMSRKMQKDIELQQKELNKIKNKRK